MNVWLLSIIYALVNVFVTLAWGLCIKDVGQITFTFESLIKLAFNKYFIAMAGLAASALFFKYVVLEKLGVLSGSFFLGLSIIPLIFVSWFLLGERPTPLTWIGIALVVLGTFLIGKQ